MGTDRRIFQYIRTKNPIYNSDHLMIVGGINSTLQKEHKKYVRRRRRFPLRRTTDPATRNQAEEEYNKLKGHIEMIEPEVTRQTKAPWISEDTWKLIDARTAKAKARSFQPGENHRLSRRIKRALYRDKKARTKTAGESIEQHLRDGRLQSAWNILQTWYKHTGDRPPKPTRLDLRQITNEYKTLYEATNPISSPIRINTTRFTIKDGIPTEAEISDAVRQLRNGRAPGQSGI
jgi:hypothetical protein